MPIIWRKGCRLSFCPHNLLCTKWPQWIGWDVSWMDSHNPFIAQGPTSIWLCFCQCQPRPHRNARSPGRLYHSIFFFQFQWYPLPLCFSLLVLLHWWWTRYGHWYVYGGANGANWQKSWYLYYPSWLHCTSLTSDWSAWWWIFTPRL